MATQICQFMLIAIPELRLDGSCLGLKSFVAAELVHTSKKFLLTTLFDEIHVDSYNRCCLLDALGIVSRNALIGYLNHK